MSQTFLPKILQEKAIEVADLALETVGEGRKSYRLFDYLKAQKDRLQVIAEVKKASPSMGDINLDVDIIQQAKTYEANGACMISVLTDRLFFKGDLSYLREVSKAVSVPTLAKDFIIDEKQIVRSFNAGATVILLIVAALTQDRLKELFDFATGLGLEVLVETHTAEELAIAHRIGAEIIGVNNRNLTTFDVSLEHTKAMAPLFEADRVYVSESGIFSSHDAHQVAPYVSAILVGTALMQSTDVASTIKELQVDKS
ncbi:indole-3-glycerol phosphate synthase TrpC [Streptococcus sp. DD12]|uniref:indole-3-glycerol phosphate synthase TrpC n=1 Tax=Streptococcus sp. DD12 TaxID=1777880 RepID=UPI00079998E5|nr:indole-3-glycerol phosphate synthase TrpC [Streptococcus sp. DD12]KXT76701.1 Indole-3-glycerol phosphate synthase [Streptococcus sp. DD12]